MYYQRFKHYFIQLFFTYFQYELFRDPSALSTLRELLVVVRVWGLLRPHCLPVFTRSAENVDVLSLLYKLLTRLAHNGCEPDDALLGKYSCIRSVQTHFILY